MFSKVALILMSWIFPLPDKEYANQAKVCFQLFSCCSHRKTLNLFGKVRRAKPNDDLIRWPAVADDSSRPLTEPAGLQRQCAPRHLRPAGKTRTPSQFASRPLKPIAPPTSAWRPANTGAERVPSRPQKFLPRQQQQQQQTASEVVLPDLVKFSQTKVKIFIMCPKDFFKSCESTDDPLLSFFTFQFIQIFFWWVRQQKRKTKKTSRLTFAAFCCGDQFSENVCVAHLHGNVTMSLCKRRQDLKETLNIWTQHLQMKQGKQSSSNYKLCLASDLLILSYLSCGKKNYQWKATRVFGWMLQPKVTTPMNECIH